MKRWQIALGVALAALAAAAGCASGAKMAGVSRAELMRAVRDRGLNPAAVIVPYELTDEARAWLAGVQTQEGNPRRRLQQLLDRMIGEAGLGIRYERGHTGTAGEVFARREANCLGFMNLFVGFARELELSVYFVTVEGVEGYEKEGDLVVISDHIAAGFGPPNEMLLLDFAAGPEIEYQAVRPVADRVAVAKFYSNRGAELLLEAGPEEARQWLATAVALGPELAPTWVNLGVARRRTGDLEGAEEAYRKALEIDPALTSAYQNLASLLRFKGLEAQALELLALTHRLRTRNPYNYINLGDWSRDAGRPEDARRFYRLALQLPDGHAEAFAALGQLELAEGRFGRARRLLRRALAADPENDRAGRLADRLGGSF